MHQRAAAFLNKFLWKFKYIKWELAVPTRVFNAQYMLYLYLYPPENNYTIDIYTVGTISNLDSFQGPLQWRHNERDCVSNHQPHECLLNGLFMRRSTKTSKLRVTGLCEGNLPVAGEFLTQRASNGESVSIWWRHLAQE